MSTTRTLSLVALAALFVLAAIAASNPTVEPPECEGTEVETCEVDGPSAGSVAATADCTNFTFRLSGVVGGSERVVRKEEYSGGEDCMEPKTLSDVTTDLPAQVSWEVVSSNASGVVRNSGSGAEVEISRVNGACRATCTFEVTVSPTVCDPPAPVVRTAEAVFVDDVRVDVGTPPRLCCVSTAHSPHLFTMEGCDCPVLRIDPPGVATIVRQDCEEALVLGIEAHEGAAAVAEAPCGLGTNTFDIVDIGPLVVSGLCGCLSASDSTQDDADAPEVETMDFGPNATGFSLSLTVAPSKWATDARWLVGRDGWMPVAGNFADGEQQTLTTGSGVLSATFDAWFDCEPDGVRASDEPKRRVTGTIARLGSLKACNEKHKGDTNACDEVYAPTDIVYVRNPGFFPENRAHELKVIETKPDDKNYPMTVSTANIMPADSLNTWNIDIPRDCGDGEFKIELTDPLHSCTSIVKTLQVKSCSCSKCGTFGECEPKNGCVDVTFGLGRTSSGGGKAPVRFVLDRTDVLPDISSESAPDGRMDVSTSNGVMTVAFTRTGEQAPMAVYTLTPGADAFTMRETRDGLLRKTVVWTLAGGAWTMEVFDETVAPRELLRRDVRTSRPTSRGVAHTLARGGEVVETETEEIDGIGPMPIRETRGTGAEARTTWKSYYKSGAAKGRVRSELSPDGSWTMYAYDPTGRVESVVSPFGDSSPVLDDRNAVIGYNGAVRMTTYSYDPVDGRDDGTTLADEPRAVVESVGSDAAGWTEVSRRYAAHFVENGVRIEVTERAASPGAAYGAEGNQRTTSSYLWLCRGAGRPLRRETSDGLVSLWAYDFTPSNVVVETTTVPAQLVGASVPACPLTVGIPHRTTIERTVEDLRGDVFREETYVVTDSGRELLSWTDFERDAAGHELRRESSDGSIVERAWSCCGPEWEMDERGIVTVWSYDALGRQATMTRSGVTTLWNYDLAGNATNVTRFADALVATTSTGYDSAGRLRWNIGEDGVRTEYAYSTSPDGGEVRTTIRAANTDCATTNTVISFRDGNTKASYLNGVLKTSETYEPFASATYEGTNGLASARWTRSENDFLGRTISESRPGFGGSMLITSNTYNTAGQLVSTLSLSTRSTRSTRLNSRLYLYDEHNDRVATVSDRNFNNAIDWTGPDLVSSNATRYVLIDGDWWRETRQWSIHDDNSAEARLMGVHRSRVTGLGRDALVASAPNAIHASESVSIDQRGNATTNRVFRNRASAEEIAWVKYPTSTTPAVTTSTNGLVCSSTSQTGVTTTFAYDAFQREVSQTDGRGNTTRTTYDNLGRVTLTIDALGYATAYGYDALGRQTSVTDPLTNTVTTAYDAEGHVVSQRGATYPVDYFYDEFGDKISMTTYRDINAAGDVTRWLRDEATGLVTNKVYADDSVAAYTYTPDALLLRETKPSGVWVENVYDAARQTVGVISSDGAQDAIMQRDRRGRVMAESNSVAHTEYCLDDSWCATNETQMVDSVSVSFEREFDAYGRLARFARVGGEESVFGYAPHGAISVVSNGNVAVEYAFANDALDAGYALTVQGGAAFSREVFRDGYLRSCIAVVSNHCGNAAQGLEYSYDALQRLVSRNTDSFGYNVRGEVTSATIDGRNESRSYDDIGNAVQVAYPANTYDYTSNCRNQYLSIAAITGGKQFVASVSYDIDGNMTRHGEWTYVYDSGNRLVSVVTNGTTIATMSYDTQGRRVKKVAVDGTHRYFYDGKLLVYEHITRPDNTISEIEYVWGNDISGTRDGAAGIGGLLYQKRDGAIYVPWYDAYGNILSYRDARGNLVASYAYDVFGNIISQSDGMADVLAFRYSTKYFDSETGFYYYGYRFYSPELMRWITRDPIGEDGGYNLYEFCMNSPLYIVDPLGDIAVIDIPGIMDAKKWDVGAALMRHWFSLDSKTPTTPNETIVTMNWVLSFERAKKVYDKIFSEKQYVNKAAQKEIVAMIKRTLKGTEGSFCPLNRPASQVEPDYVNTRPVGSLFDPRDDMYAALGKFNLRMAVSGYVKGKCAFVTSVGVYVRDSYDFVGNQSLGYWNSRTNYAGGNFLKGDKVTNESFREHASKTGRGADFLVYSDIKITTLQTAENVVLSP